MAKDIHLYPSGCLLCAHFELKMEKQDLQAVEVNHGTPLEISSGRI